MSECYSFVVNGVPCSTEEEKPLLRYLRDELRLTSVKDGCSEGACGTCTILVDGKAVKACILSTKRAAGKEIVTVEGLSEAEREAFVYAFGAVGAVQCGFCIPGMVIAGKALLDQNPNPTEAEIKKAIRGNVCRCTGYKKIIEGIALAGAILRGEASVDPALEEGEDYGVGARAFRTDVRDKVLGRGEYCDDLYLDGMAHASAVRSQYPRARVLDIDPSAALALPGVLAVLTADDVPHNKVGHLQQDWDVMIAKGDITRCVGDAICLVVAENETVLKQAKELVKVDYEPLEPVRTIQEARAADAPILHPGGNLCQQRHVTRGDARAALAQSKYVVTQSYRTPFTEHAFLEPECAVAFPYKDGVKVYTSDQGVYDTRKEISIMLGWEPECIVVENKLVGGRLWRQGGRVGAAPGGAGRPPGEPAREGKAHPAGVHQLPPQAPLYGGHLHPGLRRERHLHRPGLRDPLRHWGLRLPVRAGAGAGLHPLGGPLLLPEHRHPRLRLVHQQPPCRRLPGLRRVPE